LPTDNGLPKPQCTPLPLATALSDHAGVAGRYVTAATSFQTATQTDCAAGATDVTQCQAAVKTFSNSVETFAANMNALPCPANAAADATTIANRLLDYFNALAAAATKTTMSDMRAAISSANQTGTAIDAALATFQADLGIGSASPSPS
jgi:hypothetical protein